MSRTRRPLILAFMLLLALAAAAIPGMTRASGPIYVFDAADWGNISARAANVIRTEDYTNPDSIMLRTYRQVSGETELRSDLPIPLGQVAFLPGALPNTEPRVRIRLAPDSTGPAYSTSEWVTGLGRYLDSDSLQEAADRDDSRLFRPGRTVTYRAEFSSAYQNGTALGSAGLSCQGWDLQPNLFPNYISASVIYLPPGLQLAPGFVLPSGSLFAVVGDFSQTAVPPAFIPLGPPPAGMNEYGLNWGSDGYLTVSINGTVVTPPLLVKQPGSTATEFCQNAAYLDNNGFSQGLGVVYSGNVTLTGAQYIDLATFTVSEN